jgi:hypothetical protein
MAEEGAMPSFLRWRADAIPWHPHSLQNELLPIRTTAAAVLCAVAHGLCKETHLHLIKSVQNNTRLKFAPRYRNCFFSCLISKSSKISHDQHFCSTSDEILQYKNTSVCPVHNAQVCYFNNVWFMFLVC